MIVTLRSVFCTKSLLQIQSDRKLDGRNNFKSLDTSSSAATAVTRQGSSATSVIPSSPLPLPPAFKHRGSSATSPFQPTPFPYLYFVLN